MMKTAKVEWSEPYLGSAQVAVVPAGSDITSIDQLAGKSIAAQTGATGEQAAKDAGGEVTGLKKRTGYHECLECKSV